MPERLQEREGLARISRPAGTLLWVHAASVGEAQSALILIDRLLAAYPEIRILVTSGTVTSARLMEKRLPERAFHQFYPLDHPEWVENFINHWRPDLALWMESELWPNMLAALRERHIPAVLINARLSSLSYGRWSLVKGMAQELLGAFSAILCQTETDATRFTALGAAQVSVTDNLKYSAAPLPVAENELKALSIAVGRRPVWLYASTHQGEEDIACRLHSQLKVVLPEILTIIIPRHPDRRDTVAAICRTHGLSFRLRSQTAAPDYETDIYIADTMGEMGLFYRLCPISCIGRSFSDDGGGGHNPIEAAQLYCAVLHGPNVQFQQNIYNDMNAAGAARMVKNEAALAEALRLFLTNSSELANFQKRAYDFVKGKESVIENVMRDLSPVLQDVLPEKQKNDLTAQKQKKV